MRKKLDKYLAQPFNQFFRLESSSGILLFFVTLVALGLANSPWSDVYHRIWQQPVTLGAPDIFLLSKPLILWINDGLMAVFFFLIGLEIKRELTIGELNNLKKASLPVVAAIGGIAIPVLFFCILNGDPETAGGWGITMATDIAFALAVLKVLGNRIPLGLKIFLTAFAIVDDLVAVLCIAIFYTGDISFSLLLWALAIVAVLLLFSWRGLYSPYFFFAAGCVVWVLFLKSGVHPTLAGVLMAFTIPMQSGRHRTELFEKLKKAMNELESPAADRLPDYNQLTDHEIAVLGELQDLMDQVQSPLQNLEHKLHGWVAYFILPLFAFANAGVSLDASQGIAGLSLVIAFSLLAGKFCGIFFFSWMAVKTRICTLPSDLSFSHLAGAGLLAGIGFTMAMFITNLAFDNPEYINAAKTGILASSAIAAAAGFVFLRLTSKPRPS
ncbi:MAG: Na+/H+ antiporter NhaA [Saprospiraceae bacterium]